MSDDKSIYEQIGGEAAMNVAVEDFYRRVLSDEELAPFFDDIDMDRQIDKQKAFLTMVTGGPNQYTGRDMKSAHAVVVAKGATDRHVDLVIKHLAETLASLDVPANLIEQIGAVAESVRDDVLGRK
ncbi:MAG: group 1 truncated hemoglobin [Myxococcales bacterium]|nr:group 1 truncated hemoglobin [Myxococcales bacterium]MCB9714238.1 group 1 truncated hemoglobin [Myxococcales bacterium]